MTLDGVNGADNSRKPIQAYEGISIETIKEKGTKADARAINIYDYNDDGRLTESEVSVFNHTKRTLSDDGKTLKITNQHDGRNHEFTITSSRNVIDSNSFYSNGVYHYPPEVKTVEEKLQQMRISDDDIEFSQYADADVPDYFKNVMHGDFCLGKNAKIDINVDAGKVYVEGAEGTMNILGGYNIDLTVKDSEIEKIYVNDANVTLDGVHDRTLFFETDTDVILEGKSTLNQKNSSLDINEE